jgi:hypothetical protein
MVCSEAQQSEIDWTRYTDRGYWFPAVAVWSWPKPCPVPRRALHRIGQDPAPRRLNPLSAIFAILSTPIALPSASAISLKSCTLSERRKAGRPCYRRFSSASRTVGQPEDSTLPFEVFEVSSYTGTLKTSTPRSSTTEM